MQRFHKRWGGFTLLQRTRDFFFPPAVSDTAALDSFICGEAAYLTQKTVIGYCRVKAMLDYDKLMTEPAFRDGQDVCRWEAYASALGDVLIVVEGHLRPEHQSERVRLADALAARYDRLIDITLPPHRQDWQDAKTAFAARFATARQTEATPPDKVIGGTARLIYDLVPIHERLKREDLVVIRGDLRLHMLAAHAAMLKRFRRDDLRAALLSEAT